MKYKTVFDLEMIRNGRNADLVQSFRDDVEYHGKRGDALFYRKGRLELASGERFHVSGNEYWHHCDDDYKVVKRVPIMELPDKLFEL